MEGGLRQGGGRNWKDEAAGNGTSVGIRDRDLGRGLEDVDLKYRRAWKNKGKWRSGQSGSPVGENPGFRRRGSEGEGKWPGRVKERGIRASGRKM